MNNIMWKCLLYVTSMALLLFTGDCLFSGDSCVAEGDRAGSCQPVSECPHLLSEIQRAGTPMPARLREKLQALMCGFRSDEPMVCCVAPYTNSNHGLGVDSNWGITQPNWNNQGGNSDTSNRPGLNRPDRENEYQIIRPNTNVNSNFNPQSIARHRNLRLLPTNCGIVESDRIWGGNRTRLYEMPWMVLLKYDSARGMKLSCGGTLITEKYVLTAAHCVSFLGTRLTLNGIVLGEYDVRKDPDCERVEGEVHCAPNIRNASIESVIAHPGYSPQNLYDDIALVKLAEPADFRLDSMKPICLPTTAELLTEDLVGKNGVVAGWGATEDGLQSPILLSVDLPIIDNRDCQEAFNGNPQIHDRQICAGGVPDKDSCGGDSGGPLMYPGRISTGAVRYVQRGIVSYGPKRCGLGGFPGVYTRISHYMDWILDHIS